MAKVGCCQLKRKTLSKRHYSSIIFPANDWNNLDLSSKDVAFHKCIIPVNALLLFFDRQQHDILWCQFFSIYCSFVLSSFEVIWSSFQVSDVIQSETKRFDTTSINYLKRLWDYIVYDNNIINVWDGRMQQLHQISCSENEKSSQNNNSTNL